MGSGGGRKVDLALSEPQGSGDGRKVSLLGAQSSTDLAQVDTQMVSEVKRQLQEDSTTITERVVVRVVEKQAGIPIAEMDQAK